MCIITAIFINIEKINFPNFENCSKWKVDILPNNLYRFLDVDDPELSIILKAFNIKIPHKNTSKTIP